MKSTMLLMRCGHNGVAPLAGAWVEIFAIVGATIKLGVAPLAGAWVEIFKIAAELKLATLSLPSRERGLK